MIKSLHLLALVFVLAGHQVSGQHPAQRQVSALYDGLVAYYPFNGNANDESGFNNNPTYIGSGVTLTSDRFGNPDNAYYFDGNEGSYIRVPADSYPTTDRTISLWVNVTDLPAYQGRTPFSYGGNACNTTSFLTGINNAGNSSFWAAGHCNQSSISYTYSVSPINTWKHWVITIKGSEQKLYIDGELKTTSSYAGATYVAGKSAIIGALVYTDGNSVYVDASVGYFKGKIDDIRIYNNALTEVQVQDLYNSETSNLVAYYPFNGNANDESGNGNHGTITGAQVTPAADPYGEAGKAYKFWFPDYVSVPTNSSFFTDEFTVAYWYKVEAYWGDRCVLSCVGRNGGYQQPFSGTTFQYLFGYNFPTNSWFWTNYTVPNSPNTWQHITTTYQKTGDNASISKLYINGELKSSDTYANSIAYPGSEVFYIGRNHSDLGLNGELDEVRFYNKALNDQEIKDLYLMNTKPLLQHPANKSSVNTPTPEMQWISPMINAEFIFQLATDSLFGTILLEQQTSAFSTQLPESLLTGGQNTYWRVRSTLNGETGPWSDTWSFSYVNTGIAELQSNPALVTITPNPASNSGRITYCIPSSIAGVVMVSVDLLNSAGKTVQKLISKKQNPGTYNIDLDTKMLKAGVYYVRVISENTTTTRKLVIVH